MTGSLINIILIFFIIEYLKISRTLAPLCSSNANNIFTCTLYTFNIKHAQTHRARVYTASFPRARASEWLFYLGQASLPLTRVTSIEWSIKLPFGNTLTTKSSLTRHTPRCILFIHISKVYYHSGAFIYISR